jgi:hypothetical protein
MKEISSVVDAFNLLTLRREGDSANVIIRRSAAMLEIIIDVFMAFGFYPLGCMGFGFLSWFRSYDESAFKMLQIKVLRNI